MSRYNWPYGRNVFHRSLEAAGVAPNAPMFEFQARPPSPFDGPQLPRTVGIHSIELVLKEPVETELSLAYTANPGTLDDAVNGINISGQSLPVDENYLTRSNSRFGFAWTVLPTFVASRRINEQAMAVYGETTFWEWPDNDPLVLGLKDGENSSFVIFNSGPALCGAVICNVRWCEVVFG